MTERFPQGLPLPTFRSYQELASQCLFLLRYISLSLSYQVERSSYWCHHCQCPVINNTWDTSWDGSDCGCPSPAQSVIILFLTLCVIPFPSFLILVPIRVRRGPVVLIPGTHFPLYGPGWDGWTHVILPPLGAGEGETLTQCCASVLPRQHFH